MKRKASTGGLGEIGSQRTLELTGGVRKKFILKSGPGCTLGGVAIFFVGPQLYCDFWRTKIKVRWYFNCTFIDIFM